MIGKSGLVASPFLILLHREDIHKEHTVLFTCLHAHLRLSHADICDSYFKGHLFPDYFRGREPYLCNSCGEITLIIEAISIQIIFALRHKSGFISFKVSLMQETLEPFLKTFPLFQCFRIEPLQVIILIGIFILKGIELRFLDQHHHIRHLLVRRFDRKMTRSGGYIRNLKQKIGLRLIRNNRSRTFATENGQCKNQCQKI